MLLFSPSGKTSRGQASNGPLRLSGIIVLVIAPALEVGDSRLQPVANLFL